MAASGHCFVEWKEHFVSKERGNRVVHYFLKDISGDSILAVIGTERSVRHMFYVVSEEFLNAYGAEKSVHAGFRWRSRREVVNWLTSMLSKQHRLSDRSNKQHRKGEKERKRKDLTSSFVVSRRSLLLVGRLASVVCRRSAIFFVESASCDLHSIFCFVQIMFDHAKDRPIIFSTFHPVVALLARKLQSTYPICQLAESNTNAIFFKVNYEAGATRFKLCQDSVNFLDVDFGKMKLSF